MTLDIEIAMLLVNKILSLACTVAFFIRKDQKIECKCQLRNLFLVEILAVKICSLEPVQTLR